eukprot:11863-Eustigmatos_ZCMA.PRE.1
MLGSTVKNPVCSPPCHVLASLLFDMQQCVDPAIYIYIIFILPYGRRTDFGLVHETDVCLHPKAEIMCAHKYYWTA